MQDLQFVSNWRRPLASNVCSLHSERYILPFWRDVLAINGVVFMALPSN
jgi:hypothetical protein